MNANGLVLLINARVGRRTNRDVIGVYGVVLEHFLHGDPDRRTASPHGNQERRSKSAFYDESGELHRVPEQGVGGNEKLVHGKQAYCNSGSRRTFREVPS